MNKFNLNDRVNVVGKDVCGKIAYIGKTHFSEGEWFGIILDEAKGRNNGSINGERYFKCPRNYGIFVRACQLQKEDTRAKNLNAPKVIYPNYLRSSLKKKSNSLTLSNSLFVKDEDDDAQVKKSVSDHLIPPENDSKHVLKNSVESFKSGDQQTKGKKLKDKLRRMSDDLSKTTEKENYLRSELLTVQNQVTSLEIILKKCEKNLATSEKKRRKLETSIKLLSEITETAVIEKEIAEEKFEQLESLSKNETEKSKCLELELEIMKQEMEIQTVSGVPAVHLLKKLENKNCVLNSALLKLRDKYLSLQNQLLDNEKAAEKNCEEMKGLKETEKNLGDTICKLKEEIAEICDTVDGLLHADELIVEVTERSLNFEEKISQLQQALNDTEDELELSKETEETLQEIKLICREEIECLELKFKGAQTALYQTNLLLKNSEEIIHKYRDLTAVLREKNWKISEELETACREKKEVAMVNENLKLKIQQRNRKDMNDLIQIERMKIDLDIFRQELSYWSLFMPENFFVRGGENFAIQVKLTTSKMLKMLNLLTHQLQLFLFKSYDKKDSDELWTLTTGTKFLISVHELQGLLEMYSAFFDQTDAKHFIAQGKHYDVMIRTNSKISNYLTLLCKGEIDRNGFLLDNPQNTYCILSQLLNCNFMPEPLKTVANLKCYLNIIQSCCKCIVVCCSFVDTLGFISDHKIEAEHVSDVSQRVITTAASLLNFVRECEKENMYFAPSVVQKLMDISTFFQDMINYFLSICTMFIVETNETNPSLARCKIESYGDIISKLEEKSMEFEELKTAIKNGDFFTECEITLHQSPSIESWAWGKKLEHKNIINSVVNKLATCEQEIVNLTESLQKQQKLEKQVSQKIFKDSSQQTEDFVVTENENFSLYSGDSTPDYLILQLHNMECTMQYLSQKNFELRIALIKERQSILTPLRMFPKSRYQPDVHDICVLQKRLNRVAGKLRGIIVPLVVDITKKRSNKERVYKQYFTQRMFIRKEIEEELENIKTEIRSLQCSPHSIWCNANSFSLRRIKDGALTQC